MALPDHQARSYPSLTSRQAAPYPLLRTPLYSDGVASSCPQWRPSSPVTSLR